MFIGLGAVVGAIGMISDPSGKAMKMDSMLPYFEKLPFSDLLFKNLKFSGYALLIVNGITQLFTAFLLIRKDKNCYHCAIGCGVILMLWICIQFYMFPLNFMSTTYFIFGLIEMISGIAVLCKEKRIKS